VSYTRGVQVIEWLFEKKALLPFSRPQRDELAWEVDRMFDNRDSQFAVASIAQDNRLRELVAKWRAEYVMEHNKIPDDRRDESGWVVLKDCAAELEQLLSRDSGGTKP
jgi:hypothetical protein